MLIHRLIKLALAIKLLHLWLISAGSKGHSVMTWAPLSFLRI